MTSNDIPTTLFHLAVECDLGLAASDIIRTRRQAGLLHGPLRDSFDVSDIAVTATSLLLKEVQRRSLRVWDAMPQAVAAERVRICAGLAGLHLPPVRIDSQGRFAVTLDHNGNLPCTDWLVMRLNREAERARNYLDSIDTGEWVDPNALAGAVADIHDTALMIVTVLAVGGPLAQMEVRG